MSWIRLDDNISHHRKFTDAGPVASWLWICGQSYCARFLTDGFIPASALPLLGSVPMVARHAAVLLQVGLWEQVEGGYRVHDYHDYQPSRDEVLEQRHFRREAGRRGGVQKAERQRRAASKSPSKRLANATTLASRLPGSEQRLATHDDATMSVANVCPVPVPGTDGTENVPSVPRRPHGLRDASDAGFEAFWAAFPRKFGKRSAWKVWTRLHPTAALAARIIAAVERQRGSPQWTKDGGEFIPHPDKWLRQERWEDEGTDPVIRTASDANWAEECQARHQGRCNGRRAHGVQMQLDAARADLAVR